MQLQAEIKLGSRVLWEAGVYLAAGVGVGGGEEDLRGIIGSRDELTTSSFMIFHSFFLFQQVSVRVFFVDFGDFSFSGKWEFFSPPSGGVQFSVPDMVTGGTVSFLLVKQPFWLFRISILFFVCRCIGSCTLRCGL